MKLEELQGWTYSDVFGGYSYGGTVDITGPDDEGDIEIETEGAYGSEHRFLPAAVLANHLRLAGWTVIPPGEDAS